MKHQTLSDSLISSVLALYNFGPSPEMCDSIRTYVDLLLRWNQKMALTAIVDPIEILRLHFGESFFGVGAVPIRHGRLADVGTGAGFPAIPIRMAIPDLTCTLIESNQKKATFLAEVVRTLQLRQTDIFRGRMEDFPESSAPFDFIISRALGIHQEFIKWSGRRLSPGGKVVFWIGEQDAANVSQNSDFAWSPLAKIPGSDRRALLIGSKVPAQPREAHCST
jgi:16S rRNA (guanine527-N7)-methyltransferase